MRTHQVQAEDPLRSKRPSRLAWLVASVVVLAIAAASAIWWNAPAAHRVESSALAPEVNQESVAQKLAPLAPGELREPREEKRSPALWPANACRITCPSADLRVGAPVLVLGRVAGSGAGVAEAVLVRGHCSDASTVAFAATSDDQVLAGSNGCFEIERVDSGRAVLPTSRWLAEDRVHHGQNRSLCRCIFALADRIGFGTVR